jgi:hypothetical protein
MVVWGAGVKVKGGMGRSKSTRKASQGINEEEMEENVRPCRSLGADDLIVTDEIIFRRRVGVGVVVGLGLG